MCLFLHSPQAMAQAKARPEPGQHEGLWPGLRLHETLGPSIQAKALGLRAKPGQHITSAAENRNNATGIPLLAESTPRAIHKSSRKLHNPKVPSKTSCRLWQYFQANSLISLRAMQIRKWSSCFKRGRYLNMASVTSGL